MILFSPFYYFATIFFCFWNRRVWPILVSAAKSGCNGCDRMKHKEREGDTMDYVELSAQEKSKRGFEWGLPISYGWKYVRKLVFAVFDSKKVVFIL